MRYDTPIFFQTVTPGEFDPNTHNYGEDSVVEVKQYASVTDSGIETLKLIYGNLKQGSLTVRLQRPYTAPFNSIRIGEKTTYKVDFSRGNRVFVISEVQ